MKKPKRQAAIHYAPQSCHLSSCRNPSLIRSILNGYPSSVNCGFRRDLSNLNHGDAPFEVIRKAISSKNSHSKKLQHLHGHRRPGSPYVSRFHPKIIHSRTSNAHELTQQKAGQHAAHDEMATNPSSFKIMQKD